MQRSCNKQMIFDTNIKKNTSNITYINRPSENENENKNEKEKPKNIDKIEKKGNVTMYYRPTININEEQDKSRIVECVKCHDEIKCREAESIYSNIPDKNGKNILYYCLDKKLCDKIYNDDLNLKKEIKHKKELSEREYYEGNNNDLLNLRALYRDGIVYGYDTKTETYYNAPISGEFKYKYYKVNENKLKKLLPMLSERLKEIQGPLSVIVSDDNKETPQYFELDQFDENELIKLGNFLEDGIDYIYNNKTDEYYKANLTGNLKNKYIKLNLDEIDKIKPTIERIKSKYINYKPSMLNNQMNNVIKTLGQDIQYVHIEDDKN